MASRASLVEILREVQATRREVDQAGPAAGSPAAGDQQWSIDAHGSSEFADYVILLLHTWTEVACDHLEATASVIEQRSADFSVVPLVRAAAEHFAYCMWLLAPATMTAEERAARGMLVDVETAFRVKQATERLTGHRSSLAEAARVDYTRVLAKAAKLGPLEKRPPAKLLGQARPGATDAMAMLGARIASPEEFAGIYNWLSTLGSHPTSAVVKAEGHPPYLASMDHYVLDRVVRVGVRTATEVLRHFAVYVGWDSDPGDALAVRAEAVFSNRY